eukprot:4212502-Ditylum_brightwellii.AAC.1
MEKAKKVEAEGKKNPDVVKSNKDIITPEVAMSFFTKKVLSTSSAQAKPGFFNSDLGRHPPIAPTLPP